MNIELRRIDFNKIIRAQENVAKILKSRFNNLSVEEILIIAGQVVGACVEQFVEKDGTP